VLFPTQKKHVSFSEIKEHDECAHKHWLKHVQKVNLFKPNVHTEFGTSVHEVGEHFLNTQEIDASIGVKEIRERWKKYKLNEPDEDGEPPEHDEEYYVKAAENVVDEIPMFLDLTFPNWKPVAAEFYLYEPLPFRKDMSFKGYIDGIIQTEQDPDEYLILDWKTCQKPWKPWKRNYEILKYQLIYYREFWAAKQKIPKDSVRCGFVTLTYGEEWTGPRCELIEVTPKRIRRQSALKVLTNMVRSVQAGNHPKTYKNKWGSNCKFCDFAETKYCNGKK
jgi:hypothetical protein